MKMRKLIFLLTVVMLSGLLASCGTESTENEQQGALSPMEVLDKCMKEYACRTSTTEEGLRNIIKLYSSMKDKEYCWYMSLAMFHNALNEYSTAMALLDSAEMLDSSPSSASQIYLTRGYILEDRGWRDKAQVYYDKAVQACYSYRNALEEGRFDVRDFTQSWAAIYAAKGMTAATDFAKAELAKPNINSYDSAFVSSFLDYSSQHFTGRSEYVHFLAVGFYIVSQEELDKLRFVDDFYTAFNEELNKDKSSFSPLIRSTFSSDLIDSLIKDKTPILGDGIGGLKKHLRGEITVSSARETDWFVVTYHKKDYSLKNRVHVGREKGKYVIDRIFWAK